MGLFSSIGDAVKSAGKWVGNAAKDVGGFAAKNAGTIGTIAGGALGGPGGAALGGSIGGAVSGIANGGRKGSPRRTSAGSPTVRPVSIASPPPRSQEKRRRSGGLFGDIGATFDFGGAAGSVDYKDGQISGNVGVGNDAAENERREQESERRRNVAKNAASDLKLVAYLGGGGIAAYILAKTLSGRR